MRYANRLLMRGFFVVWLLTDLFGCTKKISYRVNQDEGFLVIARHERHRSAGTETFRTVLEYEVTVSGPDGRFVLNPPRAGIFGTRTATFLVLSRPGYRLYRGPDRGPVAPGVPEDGGWHFEIAPAEDYPHEQAAAWLFDQEVDRCLDHLDDPQRRLVQAHQASRRAFIETHYAEEAARELRQGDRRSFTALPPLPAGNFGEHRAVLDAGLSPVGNLVVVTRTDRGRVLVFLDQQHQVLREILLKGTGPHVGLAVTEHGIWVVDAGRIQQYGFDGASVRTVALDPGPTATDPVTSLVLAPDGYLVAVDRGRAPARILRYDTGGALLDERVVPEIRSLERILGLVNGDYVVHGTYQGPFDYELTVAGMKKVDGMPRGVARISPDSGALEMVLPGVDTAIRSPDGLFAYAGDLYAPENQVLVQAGYPGVLHQVILRTTLDGTVQETFDVTSEQVAGTPLRMGTGSGTRLIFFKTGAPVVVAATHLGTTILTFDLPTSSPDRSG